MKLQPLEYYFLMKNMKYPHVKTYEILKYTLDILLLEVITLYIIFSCSR